MVFPPILRLARCLAYGSLLTYCLRRIPVEPTAAIGRPVLLYRLSL